MVLNLRQTTAPAPSVVSRVAGSRGRPWRGAWQIRRAVGGEQPAAHLRPACSSWPASMNLAADARRSARTSLRAFLHLDYATYRFQSPPQRRRASSADCSGQVAERRTVVPMRSADHFGGGWPPLDTRRRSGRISGVPLDSRPLPHGGEKTSQADDQGTDSKELMPCRLPEIRLWYSKHLQAWHWLGSSARATSDRFVELATRLPLLVRSGAVEGDLISGVTRSSRAIDINYASPFCSARF